MLNKSMNLVKRDTAITLAIILLIIVLFGYFTYQVRINDQDSVTVSDAELALGVAPGQTPYTDLNGNVVSLSDYVGKVIVVNSWASWSPASAIELPLLNNVSKEYSSDEVVFLAINRAEPGSTAKSFLDAFEISEDIQLVLDADDRYFDSIAGFNMPETVYYDERGKLVVHKRGPSSVHEIRRNIEAAQSSK
tara:strand:+ start:1390 stop:1965 length:576 start_codon:yes stop_codon:yes gene_type:complete